MLNPRQLARYTQGVIRDTFPTSTIDLEQFILINFRNSPKYRDYLLDQSTHATLTGAKRGGKSCLVAGELILMDQFIAVEKSGFMLYASTTVEHSKRLLEKRLLQLQRKYKFNWKVRLSKNYIETENGNTILFAGLKDMKSAYDLQGQPYKTASFDEAYLINDKVITYTIQEVVEGGMADFKGKARLRLISNPPPVHSGFLWRSIQNPEWSSHFINYLDNPFFTEQEKNSWIENTLKKRGETMDTLSVTSKRMIFGHHIEDKSRTILSFKTDDYYKSLPKEKNQYEFFCSIDLGFNDDTAISIIAYDPIDDIVFIEKEELHSGISISQLVDQLKPLLSHYDTKGRNIIDTQGGGKLTAHSIQTDYNIPMISAEKSKKLHYVKLIQSYNIDRKLKVKENSLIFQEAQSIQMKADGTGIDETFFHSDIFYAIFYGFRYIYKEFKENQQQQQQNVEDEQPIDKLIKRIKRNKISEKNIKDNQYLF